jgi:type VI secretion system protein ImpA
MTRETDSLLRPISADTPCGEDLEDTQLLAGFDAFHLFGNDTPLPPDTPWREIREKSDEVLEKSRDLRLLAHLAAALVRTEGLASFCSVLTVMDRWLTERGDLVFPRVAEDALLRKNALNSFADRMAVVDGLRRAPIVAHRQLGSYSLRDVEIASGQLKPTEADTNPPNTAQVEAALSATAVDELSPLAKAVDAGVAALKNVAATMQTRGGFEAAPDFDPLLKPLSRIGKLLSDHLASRGAVAVPEEAAAASCAEGVAVMSGAIKSRQDAVRAIDAAATFFRNNEPSSPVPLLLDRAKRLVSKSFLEVLEDIAPETLTEVKKISGVRNE